MALASIRQKITNGILRLAVSRKMRPEAIKHPARANTIRAMKRAFKKIPIQEIVVKGHTMATFSAPNPAPHLHIIYLHGGAYVWEGEFFHWAFVKKIMLDLGCRATCVDYPLAPEHSYIETFEMLQSGFDRLARTYPEDKFVLMGDSSGGGLALAFAQKLKIEKYPVQPEKLILLSPWLDLNLDNPKISEVEKFDPILSVNALKIAGDMYAGGADKSGYQLSPINGSLKELGEIVIFTGTHDILWPDCRKLRDKALESGAQISLFEYDEMPHIWMFLPFPEAKDVLVKIKDKLSEY